MGNYFQGFQKNHLRRVVLSMMILVISLGISAISNVPPASAATSTTTKGTAAVKAGDLTANFAGNVIGSFSDTIDLSTNKSGSITAKLNNLTVQDSTGTGRGYDVVLSATQLKGFCCEV